MLRAALLALVLIGAAAGMAAAQDVINEQPQNLPPLDIEMPANERCAADALDLSAGRFGGGLGPTIEAAEKAALAECDQQGGKTCRIDTASCDPSAPTKARARAKKN